MTLVVDYVTAVGSNVEAFLKISNTTPTVVKTFTSTFNSNANLRFINMSVSGIFLCSAGFTVAAEYVPSGASGTPRLIALRSTMGGYRVS
jgi:hypothetical protein